MMIIENVLKGVNNLKNDKFDPTFKISSNNIKFGSDQLFRMISILFQLMLSHGISNELLNRSVIISIPKDKRKSLCNSNNYRGISLNTVFNKLFEYVILEK